jgi:transcriptional regulator with XRE-family HTH domain
VPSALITPFGSLSHDGLFGERIQQQRLLLGYTQRDLALLTGIHCNTIHHWEIGKHHPRNGKKVRLLAEALRVEVAWLLWGEEGPDGSHRSHH